MTPVGTGGPGDVLDLADWRRRIADLYAGIRADGDDGALDAWERWRDIREGLFREHPQSPLPAAVRPGFRARHWPYDAAMRFRVAVERDPTRGSAGDGDDPAGPPSVQPTPLALPVSAGGAMDFARIGWVEIPFAAGTRRLAVYWLAGYAGGIFLPFRDATNGTATYGAGRYVLDAAKGADLGTSRDGRLIVDFNFAYQPSCAFDPRWACPLAPPENHLDVAVAAGERIA